MSDSTLNWITNFIWGIADDVLRDVYVRGKYRDVILPMTVIRRLDALLEPTKADVLAMKRRLDDMGMANQEGALSAATHALPFYNASPFTLADLAARPRQAQLRADFQAYLDGFSANVQEILEKFAFRDQIPKLAQADALGALIAKFLDPAINLAPTPVLDARGTMRLPGLDNHAMGTIFEELIRRFNEENNEEAGEHFTPRDVVGLMAQLIFLPIADAITPATYTLYDGACGTGGMLTVAEETLNDLAAAQGVDVSIHLYGQEVNGETYAISKADLLIKGETADNFRFGSTLSQDAFRRRTFDFMLSNPPYGKSWKTDLERMGGKNGLDDPRFVVTHDGDPEFSLITRSSDGQLLFLANLLSKMKHDTPLGSRIAEVHNGSSLFTGDAGQGESNIRRWIIENDWLEAIIALPLNMFYNTGIATYIWVLTNRKPAHRAGRVQLIDATQWYRPLRKNLGKKNCELGVEHMDQIVQTFLRFEESEQSKILPNAAFGYWKVTVERPLRLRVELDAAHVAGLTVACGTDDAPLLRAVERVAAEWGPGPHLDWNAFAVALEQAAAKSQVKLTAKRLKLAQTHLAVTDPTAAPVVKQPPSVKAAADPLSGRFATDDGRVVVYEPDPALRDTEQIPLLEEGGIAAFFAREVLPYAPDAWIDATATKIGYELSFTRYFYRPQPLRSLAAIRADIAALERETDGLLAQILADAREEA